MRRYFYLVLIFFVLVAVIILLGIINPSSNCPTQKETLTINGRSLTGLIESGQEITALMGYYACNPAQRNDVILYNLHPGSEPLVKIVKAVPGDTWSIETQDKKNRIIVNGEILTTTTGVPYEISDQSATLLGRYVQSRNNMMIENSYLILGNLSAGSMDSTRFGLVSINDFLGKVVDW